MASRVGRALASAQSNRRPACARHAYALGLRLRGERAISFQDFLERFGITLNPISTSVS